MDVKTSAKLYMKCIGTLLLCCFAFALAAMPGAAYASTASTTIPVQQIFAVAPGINQDGAFNYVLSRVDSASPLPAGAQGNDFAFTLTNNEQRDIGPISFTNAGLFEYEIRSVSSADLGITLDDTIFTVIIAVRNVGADGLIAEIRSIYMRAGNQAPGAKLEVDSIVFSKAFDALGTDPAAKINPAVVKSVQGNPATPYTFTFRLEAQGDDHAMPQGANGRISDITITGSGSANFGVWSHTAEGVFTYTVREINSGNPDFNFDTSVYTIVDTVTLVGDRLVADRIVTTVNNRQVTSMSFINTYVGTDVEVQERPPGDADVGADAEADDTTGTPGAGGTTNRPIVGPKTGDYADPTGMIASMIVSGILALFAIALIYIDRKSEEYSDELTVQHAIEPPIQA